MAIKNEVLAKKNTYRPSILQCFNYWNIINIFFALIIFKLNRILNIQEF
jgi:hypothetical protein